MEPQASVDLSGDMWRVEGVTRVPRLVRSIDYLLPDEYFACQVWGIWSAARVIELGGGNPRRFMLCVLQGDTRCDFKECDDDCDHRYWADFSFGGVVSKKDLENVANRSRSLVTSIPGNYGLAAYKQASQLLAMIEELEARQKR